MDEVTPARISAIEARVDALGQLLASTVAALGTLNAHVGVSFADNSDEAFRERMHSINAEITAVYEKLSAIWPEPE